jgi:uracil-DNA glycosylase family 4
MTWDDIFTCKVCGNENCVPPYDPSKSKFLIVGEFPGGEEEQKGIPLVGRTGTILKQQLGYLGHSLSEFAVCNLWQHEPNKNPECLELGKQVVMEQAKDKDIILLVGSEVANTFLTKNVSELNGMIVNEFLVYPFSAKVVMAMFNPAIVFHSVHGEVVLALKNFIKEVEKYE